jgi:D-alanine-D-alanine ligase
MSKHVAVLMGGWSSERPVSLSSGGACAGALESAGYKVSRIDVDRNLSAELAALSPDVAFNALHGPFGEDGMVQGVLEYLNIPYTHSGVMASSLAMDKERSKMIVKNHGVAVAESIVCSRFEAVEQAVIKPPYVIKPVREGSSFGVVIVLDGNENAKMQVLSDDWRYGDEVMVERYVAGRELTCGVRVTESGAESFGVTEIIANSSKFYDYEAKYADGGSKHVCPAEIKPNIYQIIINMSLKAHEALGCRGATRSDFRYDEERDELIWLELNTQPGMTPTSLLPELAAHAGLSFEELLVWMIEDASCLR